MGEGSASAFRGTLYGSNGGGTTWNALTGGPYSLDINPTDPNHLVAMQCDGVYKSVDGGQHWSKLPGTGVPNYDGQLMARGVNNRAYIYAVYASEGGTAAIQRTTDDGAT